MYVDILFPHSSLYKSNSKIDNIELYIKLTNDFTTSMVFV